MLTNETLEYMLREIENQDRQTPLNETGIAVESEGPHNPFTFGLKQHRPEFLLDSTDRVRVFTTGATRSADSGRYDPEGYLSPLAIERFCEYMLLHQKQPDGSVRASDNWQKGIPQEAYVKGIWRHFLHLWIRFRGGVVQDANAGHSIEEDLCAIIFNAQGMLHEIIKGKRLRPITTEPGACKVNPQAKHER